MLLGALLVLARLIIVLLGALVGVYAVTFALIALPRSVAHVMFDGALFAHGDLELPWAFFLQLLAGAAGGLLALRALRRPLRRLAGE